MLLIFSFFFFKQKTAYEMRISDWSSDVCSSDLLCRRQDGIAAGGRGGDPALLLPLRHDRPRGAGGHALASSPRHRLADALGGPHHPHRRAAVPPPCAEIGRRLVDAVVLNRASMTLLWRTPCTAGRSWAWADWHNVVM